MVPNFSFVIRDKLAGCGHPGWGDGLRGNLGELARSHKITAILTLHEHPLPEDIVGEFSLRSHHLPVQDFGTPRLDDTTEAVRFVRQEIAKGGRVVIHCSAGCGRTGTLLACCLVSEENCSPEKAVAAVRRLRPGSIETRDQEAFIGEWAAREAREKTGAKKKTPKKKRPEK